MTPPTAEVLRGALVAEARALVASLFPDLPPARGCLYFAWAICIVGRQRGFHFLLQAGSAYWPCLSPELDDGVSPNRFGYEFDPGAALEAQVLGEFPEMHVWACDPFAGELIDLTTGTWPTAAQESQGLGWRGPQPPDYWWGSPLDLPPGVSYRATRPAAELAGQLLIASFQPLDIQNQGG